MTHFRNEIVMVCTTLLIAINAFTYNTADQEFKDKNTGINHVGGHEQIT